VICHLQSPVRFVLRPVRENLFFYGNFARWQIQVKFNEALKVDLDRFNTVLAEHKLEKVQ
jgi:hypothetical protein